MGERFDVRRRLRSFGPAFAGCRSVLRTQHNAWIHAVATVAVVAAALWLRVSALEWCALTLAMAAVWSAEMLNTALEHLADAAMPEFHPLVGQAKDAAAGAVLFAAAGAAGVGLIVFAPKLVAIVTEGAAR